MAASVGHDGPAAAELGRRVRECVEQWSLSVGESYGSSTLSRVMAVRWPDGRDGVLKVQSPHRESEHEAAALAHWDGDGAVRLQAVDPGRQALVSERCRPGTALAGTDATEALAVLIDLLPRLGKPAGPPFRSLEEEAAHWTDSLPVAWEGAGRPFERRLLDAALDQLRTLAPTQPDQVLVHQDLHAGNVLRARRAPWLVIDPKPLVAERAFAVAPIVRGPELGAGRADVRRRLDRLTAELGLDRARARGWALAQTLAWAFDGHRVIARHVATARWLLDGP